jgi:hypothetical protein
MCGDSRMNISATFGYRKLWCNALCRRVDTAGVRVKYEKLVKFYAFPDDLSIANYERYMFACVEEVLRKASIGGVFHTSIVEGKWVFVRSNARPSKPSVVRAA